MVGTFLAPIGIILLPYSAKLISQNNFKELRNHVNKIFKIFFPIIFFIILILNLFSGILIKIFLKTDNSLIVFYIKNISWIFLPYMLYLVVRSVNDTYYLQPKNTYNALLALFFLLMSTYLFYYFRIFREPAFIGFFVGIIVLGFTSLNSYIKIYK
jgi:O-antigen/teichoic acid export membrane protein